MISIEPMEGSILKVTPPEKLRADDFDRIVPQVEEAVRKHGKIRLLVDASRFNGWENMDAFERHMQFIKKNQQNIERGAILTGHDWQRWVVGIIRFFVHPDLRTFEQGQEKEARQWLEGGHQAAA